MDGMLSHYGYYSGLGYGYMLLGIIFWLLIIAGVILLIKWFVEQGKPGTGKEERSAMDILKTRYAKGEITAEEFEEMKNRLV